MAKSESMKTMAKTIDYIYETSKKMIIKSWIHHENIRKYDSMDFTPPPFKTRFQRL